MRRSALGIRQILVFKAPDIRIKNFGDASFLPLWEKHNTFLLSGMLTQFCAGILRGRTFPALFMLQQNMGKINDVCEILGREGPTLSKTSGVKLGRSDVIS